MSFELGAQQPHDHHPGLHFLVNSGRNGYDPLGSIVLVEDGSGNFFGTTYSGGTDNRGTVFELVHNSNTITTLASFTSTNGEYPFAGLVEDSSGNLFGTTLVGGADSLGTVFEVAHNSNTITTLGSFTGSNGEDPWGGLVEDSSGNLFGTASMGGPYGTGTVFEVAHNSNTITTAASFANSGSSGEWPDPGLVEDSSGNLFGTTYQGGVGGYGTVFEVAHNSNTITTLVSFKGSNGQIPSGRVEDSSGNLFGTTLAGGANGTGTVFEVPRAATITVGASVDPVNFTYGTPLTNNQLSGTATATVNGQTVTVAGTFTYTSVAGTVLDAGRGQRESVTFAPNDTTDYAMATSTVLVNVARATPELSVNLVDITYGAALANGQLSGTATWIVAGQSISVAGTFRYARAAGKVLPAGDGQSEAVTFTPRDATDYTTAATTVIVNVAQPPDRAWMTVVGQQLTELYHEFLPYYNAREVASFVPSNDLVALNVANGEVAIAVRAFVDTSSEIIKLGGQVTAVRYLPVAVGMPGIEVQALLPIIKLPALGNLADVVMVSAQDRVGDPGSIAPSITANPQDRTVLPGRTVTFTAAATGIPASTVQWQVSNDGGKIFVNIPSADSTTFTFTPSITQDGDEFRAVFSNGLGQVSTKAARLLIHRSRGL